MACAIGAPNLFYLHTGGRLFHASRVVDVVRQAGVAWRWNWRALADLSALEHCVDGETLHADVRRLRSGEVVRFDRNALQSWQVPWNERVACSNASPEGAMAALADACRDYTATEVVVSMSAGFDSRLLLACLLAFGNKPRLVTMGHRGSTDARVSEAIARRFGLSLSLVPLAEEDYPNIGGAVARITGGAKTFQNWHTYLYARNANLSSSSTLFIGSNGEAARTYYLDKGIAALAADRFSSGQARHAFWRVKSRTIFQEDEIASLHPNFARELGGSGALSRAQRLEALSGGSLLRGLDEFYTDQRVTNFIANGLSLVRAHAVPAAPMMDRAWSAQVWNLPRRWKLDSRWHRFAIARACPELLEFEEETTGTRMRSSPSRFYWLPLRRRRRSAPYMDYARLLRSETMTQWIRERRDGIAPLARPELLALVMKRHATGANRVRAASFLLTMLSLLECLREEGIEIAAD